jgi:hypothetical protein
MPEFSTLTVKCAMEWAVREQSGGRYREKITEF